MAVFAPTKCALTGLPIFDGDRAIGFYIMYLGYCDPSSLFRDDEMDGGWVPNTFFIRGIHNGLSEFDEEKLEFTDSGDTYNPIKRELAKGYGYSMFHRFPTKYRCFLMHEDAYDNLCDAHGFKRVGQSMTETERWEFVLSSNCFRGVYNMGHYMPWFANSYCDTTFHYLKRDLPRKFNSNYEQEMWVASSTLLKYLDNVKDFWNFQDLMWAHNIQVLPCQRLKQDCDLKAYDELEMVRSITAKRLIQREGQYANED